MIVRSIGLDGDWNFGKGKSDYKRGSHAVAQSIETRLKSHLTDCFFAREEGVDWFNLLGSKNQLGLQLALRAVILNTPNVTGLVELSVDLDDNREITISYTARTTFTGNADDTVSTTTSFVLAESGDILTGEDGSAIMGG